MTVLPRAVQAQLAPTSKRCTYDWLTNATDAINRRAWAQRWYEANPYGYVSSSGKDPRFFNSAKFRNLIDEYLNRPRPIQLYPVYSYPQTSTKWRPPVLLRQDTSYTVKPAEVTNDAVCQAGCYTPDQQVRFEGGPVAISEAQQSGLLPLVTLSPEATLDAISFMTNQVAEYVMDDEPAEQDILVFQTSLGGEIKVTLEHPLVEPGGSIRAARDFVVGDGLVREDGSTDTIQSISAIKWVGQVYNVRPITTDLVSNVLVAQGFLNGSIAYQNELVVELNRLILREIIPEEVLPVL